jgi:hypothetical protein
MGRGRKRKSALSVRTQHPRADRRRADRQETPMQRFLQLRIATVILCLCAVSACGDDDDSTKSSSGGNKDASATNEKDGGAKDSGSKADSIEIAGDWDNQFGMEEMISDTMWADFKVIEFDNDTNIAIVQNAKDDKFNPSKFNASVWTEPKAGGFAYCQYVFGKDTEAEAKKAKNTADAKDLDKGCGGFAWTMLKPHEAGDE